MPLNTPPPAPPSDGDREILAAMEMLAAVRRDLQVIDEYMDKLNAGRPAMMLADDVSSEHRFALLGAVDDRDEKNGILLAGGSVGFGNMFTGTIRTDEDAAFVCTNILVALAQVQTFAAGGPLLFNEGPLGFDPMLMLNDQSSGRELIGGMTQGPIDRGRGAIPFSYLYALRPGIGPTVKNNLFSEFTIPRAGSVRASIYNVGAATEVGHNLRAFVTLVGYKVFGG